jgi:hypothetical protein
LALKSLWQLATREHKGNEMAILKVCMNAVCVLAALATIGCGGGGGPKLVSVNGTVTIGGKEPFKEGWVRFSPKSGSKVTGASALTDDDGNFVLVHTSQREGIEPGDYNVSFSKMKMPDGSELPDQSGEADPKSPIELGGVEFVAPEYSSLIDSKFPTKVTGKGGSFDFDIPALAPQKKIGAIPAKLRREN